MPGGAAIVHLSTIYIAYGCMPDPVSAEGRWEGTVDESRRALGASGIFRRRREPGFCPSEP